MRTLSIVVALGLVAGSAAAVVVQPGEMVAAQSGTVLQVPVGDRDVLYALLYVGEGVQPGEMWGVRDRDSSLVETGIVTRAGDVLKLDITRLIRTAPADTLELRLERVTYGGSEDKGMPEPVAVGVARQSGTLLRRPDRERRASTRELRPHVSGQAGDVGMKVYPNPFNPLTTFRMVLTGRQQVELVIYDLQGRVVRTLVRGEYAMGEHSWSWDGTDDRGARVSSGVYFYRIVAGNRVQAGKLALLK